MPLLFLIAGLGLVGCTPSISLTSPSEGSVQDGPRIPLLVRLPEGWAMAKAQTWLDGDDNTDPLGITRERQEWLGGGVDYIADLSLVDLEPGSHSLHFLAVRPDGEKLQARATFTVAPPPCELRLHVRDPQGAPLSAHITVVGPDGLVDLGGPDGPQTDPWPHDTPLNTVFAIAGEGHVRLPAEKLRLLVGRGVREGLVSVPVDCTVLRPVRELSVVIPTEISTPGMLEADLHVHTVRSTDAFVPDRLRLQAIAASGLDLAVITDHNQISDLSVPLAQVEQVAGGARVLPGCEAKIGIQGSHKGVGVGHMNAFPVELGTIARRPPKMAPKLAVHLERWRKRQVAHPYQGSLDRVVLQLNHPRGIQFFPDRKLEPNAHGLFNALGFRRDLPVGQGRNAWMLDATAQGTLPLSFDALEVVNRFSFNRYLVVRADWFALLSDGVVMTGTGNSDSHALQVEPVGFPSNLLECPAPALGQELDADCVVDAIVGGRVSVTTGPVVELTATSAEASAGSGALLATPGGTVQIQARVRAASWVPVDDVRLVVNGVVKARVSPHPRQAGEVLDQTFRFDLSVDKDAWVMVEAGWPLAVPAPEGAEALAVLGDYARVLPGYVPLGFANPVRLDVDGDGAWTPPRNLGELAPVDLGESPVGPATGAQIMDEDE